MNWFGFLSVVIAVTAGLTDGKLSWMHLTRENFTAAHNWELVKAHIRNSHHLLQVLSRPIKRNIELSETIFTLFTRNGPADGVRIYPGDVASLTAGAFNKQGPIVVATHGFLSGSDVDWMLQMKTAHLATLDCNFITIDWSVCAESILYPSAVDCTKTVGGYLAQMVEFLGQQGGDVRNMHAMGHSLGAHLVSHLSQHGVRISRITGWDPAGPLFDDNNPQDRIDPSDADLVDIIHTNCFMFGYDGLLGHYDFFPNGGDDQPGCFALDYLCDHSMSYFYYIQSLYNNKKYAAVQCLDMSSAKKGQCSGVTGYMGAISPNSAPGVYYIKVDEPATGLPPEVQENV